MLSPLFFLLLLLSPFFTNAAESKPSSLKMKLLRVPPDPSKTHLEHIHGLILSDHARHRHLLSSVAAEGEGFRMPIRSAHDAGIGEFLVRVRMGTPAQKFLLIVDTGSDLTWVKCNYNRVGSAPDTGSPLFLADRSKTFRPLPCALESCHNMRDLVPVCPTTESPCLFEYHYGTGGYGDNLADSTRTPISNAKGFYANESVTIGLTDGRRQKLKGLFVGCTLSYSDSVFDRAADGVLGLGHGDISFALQAVDRFGGKFSYCLMDYLSRRNAPYGYLTFGPNAALSQSAFQETELIMTHKLNPCYGVQVIGISIDGDILKIPMSVWNVSRGGGAVIDSGTTLTYLAEPAYSLVVGALRGRLEGIPMVEDHIFDFCYNWTDIGNVTIPKLVVHFAGRARLEPPMKSYLVEIGKGDRVRCIGFHPNGFPGRSIIGNILQQEHLWEFDLDDRKLRFQPSTCRNK